MKKNKTGYFLVTECIFRRLRRHWLIKKPRRLVFFGDSDDDTEIFRRLRRHCLKNNPRRFVFFGDSDECCSWCTRSTRAFFTISFFVAELPGTHEKHPLRLPPSARLSLDVRSNFLHSLPRKHTVAVEVYGTLIFCPVFVWSNLSFVALLSSS